jgi:glycosyltransferase involved in cell wall biosynthesis
VAVEFTVGIPTHNRRETVLLAVASALEQTRPPARVCVVADGCTDGTREALAELDDERVEILDLPKGPGYGYPHRDRVLERAGDGVVAWLGDDDLWLPDHLERAGELFDAGAAGIVHSMACLVREDGTLEPFGAHWRAPDFRDRFLGIENRTPAGAVSHRAADALAVGGWPDDVERAGDWDLWQRIVRAGVRAEAVLTPTLLFFRATGREQAWEDRVAQNRAFLTCIRDPERLARLRAENAYVWAADRHRAEAALAASEQRADRLERELSAVGAAGAQLGRELEAITGSAWWRLRRPFEPVLRLRRRLRRGLNRAWR